MLNKNTERNQTVHAVVILQGRRENAVISVLSYSCVIILCLVLLFYWKQLRDWESRWEISGRFGRAHSSQEKPVHSGKVFLWTVKLYSKAWTTHLYLSFELDQQTRECWERNSWGIEEEEKHLHYLKMKSLVMLYRLLQGKAFYLILPTYDMKI